MPLRAKLKTPCLGLPFGFVSSALALPGEMTEPGPALPTDFPAAARRSIA
jgi:hypothetical protein